MVNRRAVHKCSKTCLLKWLQRGHVAVHSAVQHFDVARSLVCARSRDNIVIFISASSLPPILYCYILHLHRATLVHARGAHWPTTFTGLSGNGSFAIERRIDRRGTRVKNGWQRWPTFPNLFVLGRRDVPRRSLFQTPSKTFPSLDLDPIGRRIEPRGSYGSAARWSIREWAKVWRPWIAN